MRSYSEDYAELLISYGFDNWSEEDITELFEDKRPKAWTEGCFFYANLVQRWDVTVLVDHQGGFWVRDGIDVDPSLLDPDLTEIPSPTKDRLH